MATDQDESEHDDARIDRGVSYSEQAYKEQQWLVQKAKSLKQSNARLSAQLNSAKETISTLQQQHETEKQELSNQVNELKTELTQFKEQLEQLQHSINTLNVALNEKQNVALQRQNESVALEQQLKSSELAKNKEIEQQQKALGHAQYELDEITQSTKKLRAKYHKYQRFIAQTKQRRSKHSEKRKRLMAKFQQLVKEAGISSIEDSKLHRQQLGAEQSESVGKQAKSQPFDKQAIHPQEYSGLVKTLKCISADFRSLSKENEGLKHQVKRQEEIQRKRSLAKKHKEADWSKKWKQQEAKIESLQAKLEEYEFIPCKVLDERGEMEDAMEYRVQWGPNVVWLDEDRVPKEAMKAWKSDHTSRNEFEGEEEQEVEDNEDDDDVDIADMEAC